MVHLINLLQLPNFPRERREIAIAPANCKLRSFFFVNDAAENTA